MSAGSRWAAWGRWLFRHRGWIFVPLGGILVLQALARYSLADGSAGEGFSVAHLGVAGILGLGLLIRLQVAGRARPGTSSRGITFEAGQLITTGMYAHLRNPLYLANLLIWAGLGLLVGPPWWVTVLVAGAALAYHLIVLAEEEFLLARFGSSYIDYCRQVPRWIPKPILRTPPWGPATRILRKNRFFSRWIADSPLVTESGSASQGSAPQVESAVKFYSSNPGPPFRRNLYCPSKQGPLWPSAEKSSEPVQGLLPSAYAAPEGHCFTWRRAMFREADTLMLVGLAGWFFIGLSAGRLPWQWTEGFLAGLWQWSPGVAALGWGWIKWLKKRSWPSKFSNPPGFSNPLG